MDQEAEKRIGQALQYLGSVFGSGYWVWPVVPDWGLRSELL